SRLNIVAAIRDLEDVKRAGGGWRGLAFGIAGIALGGFMWANAGTQAAPFAFGVSLAILSTTLILRRLRLPGRLVYSLAGGALTLFWALPGETSDWIFGKHEGAIEMFFISGIMMVAGAILLLINNTEIILALTNLLGSVARRLIPSLRMGTAYPLASRFRTGLTMYMFALIIFVLVVMAAIQVNFDKVFNDPVKTTGGWDVAGQTLPETAPQGGAAGLSTTLASGGVNLGNIAAIGGAARLEPSEVRLQTVGGSRGAGGYPLNGVDDGWLATTQYHLQSRAEGFADDAAVWRAVRENPDLVVIDIFAVPGNNAGVDDVGEWKVEGIPNTAKPFAPQRVTLTSPMTGLSRTVTIIGVTDTFIAGNFGMFANQRMVDEVFG
ncbi:MAG: hypothetical protein U0841_35000, partial [Chloroflexia bacterium]